MNEIIAEINAGFLPVRVLCQRCSGTGIDRRGTCTHCNGRGKLLVLRWMYAGLDEGDEVIELSLEELFALEQPRQLELICVPTTRVRGGAVSSRIGGKLRNDIDCTNNI